MGARAGLDGCGKSHPYQDSIPGPSNPYRVAIPNELSRPLRILARYNLNFAVLRRKSGRSMGTVEQSYILCDFWEVGNRIERCHCLVYLYHEGNFNVVKSLFSPTHCNKYTYYLTLHQFFLFLFFFCLCCLFFGPESVKEDRLDESIDVCTHGRCRYAQKLL